MSSTERGVPNRRAICSAAGSSTATTPTFSMNMDSSAVISISTDTWACSVRSIGRIGRIRLSTTPDRAMAALTSSAAPVSITASSLNPSNALPIGTMPVTTPASSPSTATRS